MNAAPNNRELIERLAAEYVLGTLRGGARRRFERWRASSGLVDERCRFWEERLMPLLQGLTPVPPPPRVWQGIRRRLGLARSAVRPGRARWLALAAGLMVVAIVGALLYWRPLAPARALESATIAAPSGDLLWRVEVYGRPGEPAQLQVRAGSQAAQPAARDYELWALPKGRAPVSLGLLPYEAGTARRSLTATQQQALASSAQIAVSLEPAGGSPTGQPTGPVVFVAPLRTMS